MNPSGRRGAVPLTTLHSRAERTAPAVCGQAGLANLRDRFREDSREGSRSPIALNHLRMAPVLPFALPTYTLDSNAENHARDRRNADADCERANRSRATA